MTLYDRPSEFAPVGEWLSYLTELGVNPVEHAKEIEEVSEIIERIASNSVE